MLQRLAEALRDAVTELQRREHLGATNIEIAPLHARELVGVDAGLDLERRRLRAIEYLCARDDDLDLAGGHVGVHGPSGSETHGSHEFDDPLGAHLLCDGERRAGRIRIERALHDAGAVAHVDEDKAAMIATLANPAGERDLFADLLGGQ